MIKFLSIMALLTVLTTPALSNSALARDDGGFGNTTFSGKAPQALGEVTPPIQAPNPADIEPAAGDAQDSTVNDEEDVQIPTENISSPPAQDKQE